MDVHTFFQWHKLLHFILPVIIIVALHKKWGLARVCTVVFIAGILKEIYDSAALADTLWVSFIDMVMSIIGILIGMIIIIVKKKLGF